MDSEVAPEHHAEHHIAHKNVAQRLSRFVLSHKIYALAAVIYLIISLINFWPVTAHLVSTVPGVGGDTYQSLWGIWFIGYSLIALHQGIWHTSLLFWPIGASLTYQTFSPIASLLATPFTAVSIPFAYNLIFFAGFCLSGLTMFILARYITKNSYAAFIAGLIFTFSAFHITQAYGHLDYANIEWVPLALYFFLRIVKEDHGRNLKALALSVCMILACFTGDVQTGIVLIFLLIVLTIIYILMKSTRSRILNMGFYKAVGIFLVATFVLGCWAWIPIVSSMVHGGGASLQSLSDVQHNALWSDDILSFFVPTPYNGIFGRLSLAYASIYHGDISETSSYLTYTAIILAVIALWKSFKENRLWLALAVVFGIMALGPILLVAGSNTGVPLPYMAYRLLPFFNTVREPGRFDMIVTIALAIMAAYGVKALTEHKHHASDTSMPLINARTLGIIAVIAILLLVESNGIPTSALVARAVTTNATIPGIYTQIGGVAGNFTVLQLPIIPDQSSSVPELYSGKAMYYQSASQKPIVGGYTTRENNTQQLSLYQIPVAVQATSLLDYGQLIYESPISENYSNQTLLTLYNYNTAFVVIDRTAYNQTQFELLVGYLYNMLGKPIYNDNYTTVFSTQNAISRAVYNSYVAYPVLSDWNQTVSFVNGSYVQQWNPIGPGAVSVFAPVQNQSDLQNTLYHNQVYYANTTVTVVAKSSYPQALYLGVPTGTANYSIIGAQNLTTQFQKFSFKVRMPAGPIGNTFFFIGQYHSYPIQIKNISFSKGS
jgi:hypothetical protein